MAADCGDVREQRFSFAAQGFITMFFGVGQDKGPGVTGCVADVKGYYFSTLILAGVAALHCAIDSMVLRTA